MTTAVSARQVQQGVVFDITPGDDSSDENCFDDEIFDTYKRDLKNLARRNKYKSGVASFADIKKHMKPITDDELVLKEDLKHGIGSIVPEGSLVSFHYEAFVEGKADPFDSTRIRDKPHKCLIGEGNLLPGLELGVRTMRKGEYARFIVDSSYAFGEMGCPPRIPGGASVLYDVEMLNFIPAKDVIEFEDMTPEEQKKAPFEKISSVFQCENTVANELFRKRAYKPAIARYRKAVKLLEDVSVKDEAEDDKRNEYLLKLYLNLAQCYLSIQNPQKTIIYADLALKINPNHVKGLYRMGYALFLLEEYNQAEYYLNKAKQHKPYEKSITTAIVKLQQKRQLYEDWEKKFCRNMFGSIPVKKSRTDAQELFFRSICEEVDSFLKTDETELQFSPGLTAEQLDILKDVAQEKDLAFVSKIMMGHKINKLAKKKNSL